MPSPAIFLLSTPEAIRTPEYSPCTRPRDHLRITGEWNTTSVPKNHGRSRNRDKVTPPNQRLGSVPVGATPAIFLLSPAETTKDSRVLSLPQDLGITSG